MKIADNVRIGTARGNYNGTVRIEVTIYETDHGRELFIMGEVGPPSDPYAVGQVRDALSDINRYAKGWNAHKVKRLADIWNAWHINLMWHGKQLPESIVTELTEMFKTE